MRRVHLVGACAGLLALTFHGVCLAQPAPDPPAVASAPDAASPASPAALKALVERVDETTFLLEPDGFDEMLRDPAWLSRQARIIPHYQGGKPQGFKLLGIRKGSLWALFGLKNGDIVRAVNGRAFTSPQAALEIYEQVRGGSFVVDLDREGAPLRLTYNLRGKPEAVAPAAPPPMVAPASTAPASTAPAVPAEYRGGGRLRAHVSLDFGETPGDVTGTLRVMTDAPGVWAEITGAEKNDMIPTIDFGRGELLLRVSPGEGVPSVQIVTFQVDGGDLAVTADPQSALTFQPGRGLEGARLDLTFAVTAGANASDAVRGLLSADKDMTIACSGPLLSPRCRVKPGSR